MRLLLTRAAADAARTRRKLEALGHEVIVSPVIAMVGTGAVWPSGVVDAVLAASAQAFSTPLRGPSPETRRLLPLLLVGARTAEIAREAGYAGPVTTAKTAATLAHILAGRPHLPGRIVYLAGRDRKPDLEQALIALGRAPDILEVYEARECEAPTEAAVRAFERRAVDGVLHYSRRSAEILARVASHHALDIGGLAHFCLSEDAAAPLRAAGCATIRVAAAPNETDLLALVGPA